MSDKVSSLGIYVKLGETPKLDVFYHALPERPDTYVAVPGNIYLNPYVVQSETREGWIAVGGYNDANYSQVITVYTLVRHFRRVAETLLAEAEQQQREKNRWLDVIEKIQDEIKGKH